MKLYAQPWWFTFVLFDGSNATTQRALEISQNSSMPLAARQLPPPGQGKRNHPKKKRKEKKMIGPTIQAPGSHFPSAMPVMQMLAIYLGLTMLDRFVDLSQPICSRRFFAAH